MDGRSITFMGYQGGPGCGGFPVSPTAPNLVDVSASNTPAICDPTNAVISSFASTPVVPTAYYRAVAEVDGDGHLSITDGNAYSGDNGRAAIKGGNGLYYMVGNDNSGNLSKAQLPITPIGIDLVNATGSELLVPGGVPPVPPNVGMIGRLLFGKDKPGKDTNFRGMTIFNNTLYITKGSGGNGINTVYQLGTAGTLPTGAAADLAKVPIAILPGFPNTAASTRNFVSVWDLVRRREYSLCFGRGRWGVGDACGQWKCGGRSIVGDGRRREVEFGERNLDYAIRFARWVEYWGAVWRGELSSGA